MMNSENHARKLSKDHQKKKLEAKHYETKLSSKLIICLKHTFFRNVSDFEDRPLDNGDFPNMKSAIKCFETHWVN